jgi:hypothetical protein
LAGDTVFLAGPFIKIYQLASFRTEGTPRIVLPINSFSAGRTIRHEEKVRRNDIKVKDAYLECAGCRVAATALWAGCSDLTLRSWRFAGTRGALPVEDQDESKAPSPQRYSRRAPILRAVKSRENSPKKWA